MAARLAGLLSSVRLDSLALLHPGTSGPAAGSCWLRWRNNEVMKKDLDRRDKAEGSLRINPIFYRRWRPLNPLFIVSPFGQFCHCCLGVSFAVLLCAQSSRCILISAQWVPLIGGPLMLFTACPCVFDVCLCVVNPCPCWCDIIIYTITAVLVQPAVRVI